MNKMRVSLDLAKLWLHNVATGKTVNTFDVGYDDPDGRWARGDLVEVGLKLGDNSRPEFFAKNLTQKRRLDVAPEKPEIGDGFKKCFFPHRLLRADMPKERGLGRQAGPSGDLGKCNYFCQNPHHPYSLLRREPLCVLTLPNGHLWVLYYNFAPFEEEGHFLWLPAVFSGMALMLPHFPQVMTQEFLLSIVMLFEGSEGFLYFFNSLHAGATQHHFHYQLVYVGDEVVAIERAPTAASNVAGIRFLDDYPIEGLVFEASGDPALLWQCIDKLQQKDIPFNLIMVRGRIFLIPRNSAQEIVAEFPFGVLASVELAGKIILTDRRNFEATTLESVVSAFKKTSLSREEIASVTSVQPAPA